MHWLSPFNYVSFSLYRSERVHLKTLQMRYNKSVQAYYCKAKGDTNMAPKVDSLLRTKWMCSTTLIIQLQGSRNYRRTSGARRRSHVSPLYG